MVRESVAQCINQALECPMIASVITRTHRVGIYTENRAGVPLPTLPADESQNYNQTSTYG